MAHRVPAGRGAVAAALLAALAGCSAGSRAASPAAALPSSPTVPTEPAGQRAIVVSIVDGDTVRLRGVGAGPLPDGEVRNVRLLEIDTPEREHCGYADATARLAGLIPRAATVVVEADRDPIDRFGRHLLYLRTSDGRFVNLLMVEQGFARAVLFAPNDGHIDVMRAAEASARSERRGLWRTCGGIG